MGLSAGLNGPFTGFVETAEPTEEKADGDYGLYALDAEMVYTVHGLELAKISVVAYDGSEVYERLVRPDAPIIDYNTQFSGITPAMMQSRHVVTLGQVQRDLLIIFNARTILVGHAINNDLRSLKMLHRNIVDTSLVFKHFKGDPFRLSLKVLVKTHLQRDIQTSDDGHDSYEDARNTLGVLLHAVRRRMLEEKPATQE